MSIRTLKIISILITIVGVAVVWQDGIFRQPGDQSGYEPIQPINFSHKVHAGDNSINCTYCHTPADKSRVAGIPSATLCMNCHTEVTPDSPEIAKVMASLKESRPIEWTKVNDLPDHVVFNHSRHVTAGVNCNTCHGAVETMDKVSQFSTFSMGSCVQCHRENENVPIKLDEPLQVPLSSKQKKRIALTDCSVCHH